MLQLFLLAVLFMLVFAGLQMFALQQVAHSAKSNTLKHEGQHRSHTASVAQEMGLDFHTSHRIETEIADFKIWRLGDKARARNVVAAETEIASISLFEFEYDFGTRKYPRTHKRRVALVESGSLDLPAFDVESAHAKLPSARQYFDKCQVKFLTDLSFDQLFSLHGSDASNIRKCFDEVARDCLRAQPDLYIEAVGNKLLICFPGEDFSGHSLRPQFASAFEWFKVFSRADLDHDCVAHEIERILATAGG